MLLLVLVGGRSYIGPGSIPGRAPATTDRGMGVRLARSVDGASAEVLRVDRPGLAMAERIRQLAADAYRRVAEAPIEDVRAMPRRCHPRGDDRARGRQRSRAPGDVLADGVADVRAVDVAGGAYPAERRAAQGTDVVEVAAQGHALGVALGGPLQPPVLIERPLAMGGSFAVDQAEGRRADQLEVPPVWHEGGVGAAPAGTRCATATRGPLVVGGALAAAGLGAVPRRVAVGARAERRRARGGCRRADRGERREEEDAWACHVPPIGPSAPPVEGMRAGLQRGALGCRGMAPPARRTVG